MKKVWVISFCFLMLSGCTDEQSEAEVEPVEVEGELAVYLEEKYGETFDWTLVNGTVSHGEQPMMPVGDVMEMYRNMGVELEPYYSDYITHYHFDIAESCTMSDGEEQTFRFSVMLNEDETKIIGDYMVLDGYEPGGIKTTGSQVLFDRLGCE